MGEEKAVGAARGKAHLEAEWVGPVSSFLAEMAVLSTALWLLHRMWP